MNAGKWLALPLICVLCASASCASAQSKPRNLVAINAPQHDPLFVDADSLQRAGAVVSFKYVLDVLAAPSDDNQPRSWRSNEIEASIDCSGHTVTVRRLVAYPGPRGSGVPTAVHAFTAPGVKPQAIAPKSTFAYLESYACGAGRG